MGRAAAASGPRRVAIVGGGVAGLVAAHALHPRHEITLFEQHQYLGGHAHTIDVPDGGRSVPVDTGFIVFNELTYPLFSRLLRELGVASQPSEMSFGVSCRRCGVEYSSRGVKGLFARKSQAFNPGLYRMAIDIVRFNRWALAQADAASNGGTIGDLRRAGLFGRELFAHYLLPMTGAIWSSPGGDVDAMPLAFLLAFYRNHGLLQTHGHPVWRTVTGGSRRYVAALTRPFRDRIRLGTPVAVVRRHDDQVMLRLPDGWAAFDAVVVATHTDEALAMLEDASGEERTALSSIAYHRGEVVLHADGSVLPRAHAARASWNVHVDDCGRTGEPLRMTYDLRRLQRLDTRAPWCVTVNDDGRVASDRVVARMVYTHPLDTVEGLEARRRLRLLNGRQRTFFCGAYMGNGFHEDGVRAGIEAAHLIEAGVAAG